ncbi:MAG: ribbon-helix-helix domain-containing protein [Candidatus Desulfofervidus auxilii]|nr:ribbon-helix-helix domain-containing protein [Candidatus Desulfofervidus auxilii]
MKRIMITIEKELLKKIDAITKNRSAFIRNAVIDYLKKIEKEKKLEQLISEIEKSKIKVPKDFKFSREDIYET